MEVTSEALRCSEDQLQLGPSRPLRYEHFVNRRCAASRRSIALAQVLLWAFARSASAEVRGLQLEWEAPNECPKANAVLTEVDSHLSPDWKPAEPVRVRAIVSSAGTNDWRVALSVYRRDGLSRRTLRAETCSALADATALVIALALDPGVARVAPDNELSPEEPGRDPQSGSAAANGTRLPLSLAFGTGAAADTGALPELAWGVNGVVAARVRRFRLELVGGYFFPQTSAIEGHPTASATFDLLYSRLQACLSWPVDAISVGPCAGFEIGRIVAESQGVRQPSAGDALWLAAAAGGAVEWDFARPFSMGLAVLAEIPLQNPNFVIQGLGVSAHRVESASLRLQAVLLYTMD